MADLIIKPTSGTGNKLILRNQNNDAILTTGDSATDSIFPAGHILQVLYTQDLTMETGGTIPLDDTIPQNSEGSERMTLAITPKSATNKLLFNVTVSAANSSAHGWLIAGLFQDTTANALASNVTMIASQANGAGIVTINYQMTSGTASATTFKIRAGCSGGTTTFNGSNGARLFGGTLTSSMSITEIQG